MISSAAGGRDNAAGGSACPGQRSTLSIGPLALANNVALAPMAGITDAPFRRLVAKLGAGLVVSEMTAGEALTAGEKEARLRVERPGVGWHVIQLAGCVPSLMAEAARIAEASGADAIDINMGCPSKRVVNGQAGAALMRDPALALALVEATVSAVRVPVTLKMRLGWDEHALNAAELAQRAESAGVQLITVHGRTRRQFYAGSADHAAIAEVKSTLTIPVIANGDIVCCDSAQRALAFSQADGVMIGRGAQGRPWLPGQLARYLKTGARERDPDLPTQLRMLLQLYEAMLSHYGSAIGIRHARKHLGWALNVAAACATIPVARLKAARERVLTACEPKLVVRRLHEAFDAFGAAV